MPRFVAFLRAVNVRPRMLPMQTVRAALTDAGFTDVQTHIQTGNVLVGTTRRSPRAVAATVNEILGAAAGFDIVSMVRTPQQVAEVVSWVDATPPMLPDGGRRYVAFALDPVPDDVARRLDSWEPASEAACVRGSEVLIELGISAHQARLTNARLERMAGPTTTRDIKVVRAIAERWS